MEKQCLYNIYRADGLMAIPSDNNGIAYLTPNDLEGLEQASRMGLAGHFVDNVYGGYHHYHDRYWKIGYSGDYTKGMAIINRFANGYITKMQYEDTNLLRVTTTTGGQAYAVIEKAQQALAAFYNKVRSLPIDCTDELYQQYADTGVYYPSSETDCNGWKLRYAIPVTASANTNYNTQRTLAEQERTAQERERTDQAEEQAYQKQYESVKTSNETRIKDLEAKKEEYESQIYYSKLVRYGLLAGMGVAAVVLLILIVLAFKSKN